jgi:hypothetical protein
MFHFFLGLFMIAAGVAVVIKTEAVLSFFGPIGFFEKYLGTEGGSRLGWKIIGLILLFFGFLIFFGLIDGFMMWLLSPLLGAGK